MHLKRELKDRYRSHSQSILHQAHASEKRIESSLEAYSIHVGGDVMHLKRELKVDDGFNDIPEILFVHASKKKIKSRWRMGDTVIIYIEGSKLVIERQE